MDDEMLFYLNEYYELWLESAIKYYFFDGVNEPTMTDQFWTGLAKNYLKHIKDFPFLKSVGFNGTTLGVGVTKDQLVSELERVRG